MAINTGWVLLLFVTCLVCSCSFVSSISVKYNITTIAGYNPLSSGIDAKMANIDGYGCFVDPSSGDLYISDNSNNRVVKVFASNGTIVTIAGTGVAGYNGDGILATQAKLSVPMSVFVFNSEVYIADSRNNRIRKILTNGTIVTVAGNGNSGYDGDGVVATETKLNGPIDVFVDSQGNIFIADYSNHYIRMVNATTRIISTIAGTGTLPGTTGTGAGFGYNGDGIPATNARLSNPEGVFVSNNNEIYIADTGNQRIRKILTNGNITTIAGGETSGYNGDSILATAALLNYPTSVCVWNNGEVLIGDNGNRRLRKILTNGTIITIAGTGIASYNGDNIQATMANVNVNRIFSNSQTEIYISDSMRIRKISTVTGLITTVAGNGGGTFSGDGSLATKAQLKFETSQFAGVFKNNKGEYLIADSSNHRIRKVLANGIITTIAGTGAFGYNGDGIPAQTAQLNYPSSVFEFNDEVYIADSVNRRIRKIFTNGTIITIAGSGVQPPNVGYSGDNGVVATNSKLYFPTSIFVTSTDEFYFADQYLVRKVKNGVTLNVAGNVNAEEIVPGSLATTGAINLVSGIYVSSTGFYFMALISSKNRVLFVDFSTNILDVYSGNGLSLGDGSAIISGGFSQPLAVYGSNNSNMMIITDKGYNRIRLASNGIISTMAGTGGILPVGFNDDGPDATKATLTPSGALITEQSEIVFVDIQKNTVRKLTPYCDSPNVLNQYFNACIPTCFGLTAEQSNVCSGNGTCISQDTCQCNTGFYGSKCTLLKCFGTLSNETSACNGHGLCVATDNCKCDSFYFGVDCKISTCNDILSNNGSTCSSRGICTSYENCTCGNYYYGKYCQNTMCYGKFSNDSSVCSSNGTCLDYNHCSCNNGSYGINCDNIKCFGKLSSDATVCGGRGMCIATDNCICQSTYSGTECQVSNCNGTVSTSSLVCSSRGNCISYDTCICGFNYFGKNCEVTLCYGTYSNNTNSCSNNGKCTDYNFCSCNSGWTGQSCNVAIPSRINSSTSNSQLGLIIGLVVGLSLLCIIILVIVLVALIIVYRIRKKKSNSYRANDLTNQTEMIELVTNSQYNTSVAATTQLSSDFPSEDSVRFKSIIGASTSNGMTVTSVMSSASNFDPASRYKNLEKIGQGGFGSVFKCNDSKMGDKMKALKVIKYSDIEELNTIMKEGTQLMNINHPNILRVNDLFIDKDQILLIDMDYYENGDLTKLIPKSSGIISENIVKQVLYQSCDALNFVHTNLKIIHRDVKPNNIFINQLEESHVSIVLADFGLAKQMYGSVNNSYAGTPLFMSPELGLGGKYSFNTDVYSLGVAIYQLCTGDIVTSISNLYMQSESTSEVKQWLKNKLSDTGKYSDPLQDIIISMLEKNPATRPQAKDIMENSYFTNQ